MARKTIAPVLSALLDDLATQGSRAMLDMQTIRIARDELARMTSVMRALEAIPLDAVIHPIPESLQRARARLGERKGATR